ncbi:MAG TPA: hydantoinase B/oxoprolinase family protein [Gammaproteobacteria bacterium]
MAEQGWHFFVDRGGTFTDIVAITPDGRLLTHKLLSENPAVYADAALAGIEQLRTLDGAADTALASVRMGTTIGTNALLERSGAATALVITAGFADLLRIGTQQRPDIFALDIELPVMLYSDVIEADERIGADGSIIAALDRDRLLGDLEAARARGAEAVAIALINAHRESAHEQAAAAIARRAGFEHVSVSSQINPEIRIVERGDTCVVDAYLTPVLEKYKARVKHGLARQLAENSLWFMQSHGGLAQADAFRGCDSVLSGPAGGVVGMAATARAAGFESVIGFDMGGTSTDISVFAGRYERTSVSRVAGSRVARPMLRINTVAAGGGSLLRFKGGRLQVGPESAGARPGPACYRNGGPLTLTDANVLLGRIQPGYFPCVFGPTSDQPIDPGAVEAAFASLGRDIAAAGPTGLSAFQLAAGFRRIAIDNMAGAIQQISVQRGHDVTQFALACFGGAGGQHACSVADALGIETVLVHPLSGVLSAYGIGVAEKRSILGAGIHARLDDATMGQAQSEFERLRAELGQEFDEQAGVECRLHLRAAGSDTLIDVPMDEQSTLSSLRQAFAAGHLMRFGFESGSSELILQSLEVEAISSMPVPAIEPPKQRSGAADPIDHRQIWFDEQWLETPVYLRSGLGAGAMITGPALIAEDNATIIVEPDWSAGLDPHGMLIMRRSEPRPRHEDVDVRPDPIMLEIFNNQFMHIAEQMGVVLEQTAHSVNIKERLDYSCAMFDRGGELIANAPHVPVHLGSMGDSVREVIRSADDLEPGDAYVLNAPYRGGTHLPDITVVTPIFIESNGTPEFFVASRAHHADIGGITPGSMPAMSHTIDEEGVVIMPTRIVRDGKLLESVIRDLLSLGNHPARNPEQNLADLRAQLAANARGKSEIERMIERYGSRVVHAYMRHVRDNAEACARDALRRLDGGRFTACMDSGERIVVAVETNRETGAALIDFTGTSGTSAGNLNAPQSVVRAVVLYVLRTLIKDNIPLNAGCLVPIELVIPPGSLLDPTPPAAVAGGNVETSQCIADALLAAFGAAAASQGTMNNFTFGDDRHQYYETICGGTGAGPGFAGASAVHSHMTNSRLTDVEVLEHRFPVRLRRFEIRSGSGGAGRWRGGDGVVREIEFLAPMRASLLANRRRVAPFGIAGGGDALPGRDLVIRRDGTVETVLATAEITLEAGDRIVIETPGGGGYGTA